MRVLELFAGAGGAALGLEAAGFEHAALVELDPDACNTLEESGLGPIVRGDVRDLPAIEWVAGSSIDLLWSSFPCQAFSIAGSRLGEHDERNGWPWTVDAIDWFEPKAFIGENVRGLLSFDYFEETILADLKKRFKHVGFWLLNAADFGVPQHRRRVFIWAAQRPLVPPRRTHGPGMFTKPWVTMRQALKLDGQTVIGGGNNPNQAYPERRYRDLTNEPSTTIAASQAGTSGPFVHHHGRNTEANPNQERPVPCSEPAPCISGKGNEILDRPSPAVLANEVKGHTNPHVDRGRAAAVSRASDALFLATGRRRLTVAECATLQGFPPDYPFQGTKKAQYRQVGNAVPPKLAQVVAETVLL
ncbi:MAG: DNA cytosine methyltransferase [Longimicrobiales bacterium]|nr:DNA cytosine methyltransferase [Longimicrobiales bacterium]